jgi:hypothetical protein
VIRIDNSGLIRRPAAAGAESDLISAQHPDMGRDPAPIYSNAAAVDGRNVTEADDRVAIWQQ